MVTPLSLLKFRLAQLCPDASRNEISTGGSVQFQDKRFPVDVDRHLKLLDFRVAHSAALTIPRTSIHLTP